MNIISFMIIIIHKNTMSRNAKNTYDYFDGQQSDNSTLDVTTDLAYFTDAACTVLL